MAVGVETGTFFALLLNVVGSVGVEEDRDGDGDGESEEEGVRSEGGVPINAVHVAPTVVSSSLLFIASGSNCWPLIVLVIEKSDNGSTMDGKEKGDMGDACNFDGSAGGAS